MQLLFAIDRVEDTMCMPKNTWKYIKSAAGEFLYPVKIKINNNDDKNVF